MLTSKYIFVRKRILKIPYLASVLVNKLHVFYVVTSVLGALVSCHDDLVYSSETDLGIESTKHFGDRHSR